MESKVCAIQFDKQDLLLSSAHVLLGSIFLALMSQIAIPIPFSPVPMSLQTLAVSLLAMTLGSKKAPLAVMAYLVQATIGLPVLAGGAVNPLWMIGPRAGYLLGFIVAAYCTAKLLEKHKPSNIFKTWLTLSANEGCILLLGSLWLSFFVGFQNAFILGMVPFIPGALAKITVAATAFKPVQYIRDQF